MMPNIQNTKKKSITYNNNILESLRSIPTEIGQVAKDLPQDFLNDALSAVFGKPVTNQSGEMQPGQPVEFAAENSPRNQFLKPENISQAPLSREEAGLKEKIKAVRLELMALASSIKALSTEIEKTISETPVNPGIYHSNFFDRLKSMLKLLREQVDDSRTWLMLQTKRKKQKIGYWGLYKKHGTSFGLSNERTLATQAG
jgi:hypothetical protein